MKESEDCDTESAWTKLGLAVLVNMAWNRLWWRLNWRRNETEKGRDGPGQVRGDTAKVLGLKEETAKSANTAAHTDPELWVLQSSHSSAVSTSGWNPVMFTPTGSQENLPEGPVPCTPEVCGNCHCKKHFSPFFMIHHSLWWSVHAWSQELNNQENTLFFKVHWI